MKHPGRHNYTITYFFYTLCTKHIKQSCSCKKSKWIMEGRMDGTHSMHRADEKCISILAREPERRRPLQKYEGNMELTAFIYFRKWTTRGSCENTNKLQVSARGTNLPYSVYLLRWLCPCNNARKITFWFLCCRCATAWSLHVARLTDGSFQPRMQKSHVFC